MGLIRRSCGHGRKPNTADNYDSSVLQYVVRAFFGGRSFRSRFIFDISGAREFWERARTHWATARVRGCGAAMGRQARRHQQERPAPGGHGGGLLPGRDGVAGGHGARARLPLPLLICSTSLRLRVAAFPRIMLHEHEYEYLKIFEPPPRCNAEPSRRGRNGCHACSQTKAGTMERYRSALQSKINLQREEMYIETRDEARILPSMPRQARIMGASARNSERMDERARRRRSMATSACAPSPCSGPSTRCSRKHKPSSTTSSAKTGT